MEDGSRPKLAAAVRDNMALAAELEGVPGARVPWAGKMRAIYVGLGRELDLNGPPAPQGIDPAWVEAVGQQEHRSRSTWKPSRTTMARG